MLNMTSHLIATILVFSIATLFFIFNKTKFNFCDLFALLFLLFFNLSFYFTTVPYGFKEFSTFNAGIITYILARNLDFKINFKSKRLFYFFNLAAGAFVIYGIYDLLSGPLDRFASVFKGDESYTSYPNAAADLILLFIFPLLATSVKNKKWIPITIVVLIGFWLTLSRGAFIAFVAGILLLLFYQKKLKQNLKSFVIICLSVIFAIGVYRFDDNSISLQGRFLGGDISAMQSLDERPLLFKGALDIIKDNYLFGIGPGGFSDVNPRYQENFFVNSEHPHNIFLKLASESGIFTMIFFSFFIFSVIFEAFKTSKNRYILIGVIAVLLHSLIDYNLNFVYIYLLFFGQLGYLSKDAKLKNINFARPVLISITVIFLFISILEFRGYYILKTNPTTQNLLELRHWYNLPIKQIYFQQILENKNYIPFSPYALEFQSRYSNHFPINMLLYHLGTPKYIHPALKLEKNNPEALLYYIKIYKSPKDVAELTSVLATYNSLLKVNSHNMVATLNPQTFLAIYDELLKLTPDPKVTTKLLDLKNEFTETYNLEKRKFNCRFK